MSRTHGVPFYVHGVTHEVVWVPPLGARIVDATQDSAPPPQQQAAAALGSSTGSLPAPAAGGAGEWGPQWEQRFSSTYKRSYRVNLDTGEKRWE